MRQPIRGDLFLAYRSSADIISVLAHCKAHCKALLLRSIRYRRTRITYVQDRSQFATLCQKPAGGSGSCAGTTSVGSSSKSGDPFTITGSDSRISPGLTGIVTEVSPWLEKTRWPKYLGGYDSAQTASLTAKADPVCEPLL